MTASMLASLVTLLIPVWILLFLVVLLGAVALLGRVQNGRYLRPVLLLLMKVPLLKKWIEKASNAAIERSNPELASAMKKMQRTGALRDPMKAQAAMSQLTRDERRALLEMQDQQGAGVAPEATNREMRRRLEKAQKNARRGR
jgi:type II secretory pathway component PulF